MLACDRLLWATWNSNQKGEETARKEALKKKDLIATTDAIIKRSPLTRPKDKLRKGLL